MLLNNTIMFEKVDLIQLREFPLKLKEGFEITPDILTNTKVGLSLRFQYQETAEDVVAMHIIVSVVNADDGDFIMRTGATIVFRYEGWQDMPHEVEAVRADSNVVDIAHYLIGIESGMFFKTMHEYIPESTPILPFFNENEVIAKMSVEQV